MSGEDDGCDRRLLFHHASPFNVVCLCHDPVAAQFRDPKVWDDKRPNQFRGLDFEAAIDLLGSA
jgi:hypothetical protein